MFEKEKIIQLLKYRRSFFLAMDKKSNQNSKYSFYGPGKLTPLFYDISTWDGSHAVCLRVCLSEMAVFYDEKVNKYYYSAIDASYLKHLAGISELESSLVINFVIPDRGKLVEVPIKASEVYEVLSKRTIFSSLLNFYKSRTGRIFIIEDICLFLFFIIFYGIFVFKPRSEARIAREKLEERRVYALTSGVRDIMDYDYQGRLVHEVCGVGSEDGIVEVFYKYDKKEKLISKESSDGKKNLYKYDGEGRLVSIKNESGLEAVYEYGEDGNLSLIKNFDGTTEECDFHNGRLSKRTLKSEEGKDRHNIYYKYDEYGNLIELSDVTREYRDYSLHYDWTYEYNSEGLKNFEQLEKVAINWGKNGGVRSNVMDEAWYMYDFYRDGTLKSVVKYYAD